MHLELHLQKRALNTILLNILLLLEVKYQGDFASEMN